MSEVFAKATIYVLARNPTAFGRISKKSNHTTKKPSQEYRKEIKRSKPKII